MSTLEPEVTPNQPQPTTSHHRASSAHRRNTPYNKTPHSRRLGLRDKTPRFERTPTVSDDSTPCFKGLVKKTWKLYRVSPLYKFATHHRDLKKYGASLSVSIAEQQRKSVLVDTKEMVRCAFSLYRELKIEAGDPECVQILLTGKSAEGVQKTLMTALLFGVEMQDSLVQAGNKYFTHYPVLMVKGPIGLSQALTDWLESRFDCRVSLMNFTSLDLSWMVAMWSGFYSGSKSKPVELLYSMPDEVTGLKTITYTIDAEDCQQLWDCIHNSKSNIFTEEEVTTFMNCLQSHFYACFKVKLSCMSLTRVGTSVAYVGSDGKIKIFTEDHVIPVLRYITELSVEKSKIL